MTLLLLIFFFTLGLIIGSFLNVVIFRMNTARSLGGRSACMSCQSKLRWYELIPLFSFMGLQGRCKNCKIKISWQYPFVEFATGVVFSVVFLKLAPMLGRQDILLIAEPRFILTYFYYVVMFSLLILVVVYDFRHKIIPDKLSFLFGLFAFISLFFVSGSGLLNFLPHMPTLLEFLSGIIVALPFALLWFFSRGAWMGLGDAKLAVGLGWFLGLATALSGIVLAFWIGTLVGVYLMLFKQGYGMKSEIPFAPYLVLGTFVAFVANLNLFQIYF